MKSSWKSHFITVEGGDGAGKSTLISHIEKFFKEKEITYSLTREPGGTALSEEIREVILKPGRTMEPLAELFLYEAARVEHVESFIKPKLREGHTILCDRFTHSSLAYQGKGRNLGVQLVRELNNLACQGLKPDLVIWLKITPETARKRRADRGGQNRLDAEAEDFHAKIYKAFSELAEDPQNRFLTLDGEKKPEEIVNDLFNHPMWCDLFVKKQKSLFSWK